MIPITTNGDRFLRPPWLFLTILIHSHNLCKCCNYIDRIIGHYYFNVAPTNCGYLYVLYEFLDKKNIYHTIWKLVQSFKTCFNLKTTVLNPSFENLKRRGLWSNLKRVQNDPGYFSVLIQFLLKYLTEKKTDLTESAIVLHCNWNFDWFHICNVVWSLDNIWTSELIEENQLG